MKPEEKARKDIDNLLSLAGWTVQNLKEINLGASLGVAVREYPTNIRPVDYALLVDRKAFGGIEAKPAGTTLSGVAEVFAQEIVENLVNLTDFEDAERMK